MLVLYDGCVFVTCFESDMDACVFVLGAGIQACLCNLLSTMWMAVARHLSKQCLDSRVHQPLSVVTQEAFGLFGRSSSSAAAVVQTRARCKSMG